MAEIENEEWKKTAYHHRPSPIWPVVLIGIGVLLLLQNFHLIADGSWEVLLHFWPLLLILLGLQLIVGRSRLANLLILIISLTVVGGLIFLIAEENPENGSGSSYSLPGLTKQTEDKLEVKSEDYPGLSSRVVDLNVAIGKLVLDDSSSDPLLSLDARHPDGFGIPVLENSSSGGKVTINLRTHDQKDNWLGSVMGERRYEVSLGQVDLPTDLVAQVSTGSLEMNLSHLNSNSLSATVSTGSAEVDLTKEALPKGKISLRASTGSVTLHLPANTGVKLAYKVGVGQVRLNSTNLRGNGSYTYSPENMDQQIEVEAEVGTGTINIE